MPSQVATSFASLFGLVDYTWNHIRPASMDTHSEYFLFPTQSCGGDPRRQGNNSPALFHSPTLA